MLEPVKYLGWRCRCACGTERLIGAYELRHNKDGGCRKCNLLQVRQSNGLIAGKQVGLLTVVSFSHKNKWGTLYYACKCSCGNNVSASASRLLSGRTASCGRKCVDHRRIENAPLVGKVFGRLTVVGFSTSKKGRVYLRCACSCGNYIETARDSLKGGSSTSCGCYSAEFKRSAYRQPKGESAFRRLFRDYRYRSARGRGFVFSLTEDHFRALIFQDCHYCGCPPFNRFNHHLGRSPESDQWNELIYNGIDRKDNSAGYTVENSVPCCKVCNFMKRAMPYDEFIERSCMIAAHQGTKKKSVGENSEPKGVPEPKEAA